MKDWQMMVSVFICLSKFAECIMIGWAVWEFKKFRKHNIIVIHQKGTAHEQN